MVLKPTGGWGYQSDTEFIFPMRVAPQLRQLKDARWQELVDRAVSAPDGSEEQLAFSLLLVRLAGCLTCHTDSYRALRGCTICAQQVIRRQRADGGELERLLDDAREQVLEYLEAPAHPKTPCEQLTSTQ